MKEIPSVGRNGGGKWESRIIDDFWGSIVIVISLFDEIVIGIPHVGRFLDEIVKQKPEF